MTIDKVVYRDDVKETESHRWLQGVLDSEPYCDYWFSKIRILEHIRDMPSHERELFLVETLAHLMDAVAYDRDKEKEGCEI